MSHYFTVPENTSLLQVYDILDKDIGLILPKFEDREKNINQRCQKRQIISALISGFIGLAFEGISSFLQHKQEKALQQAMHTMNKRVNIRKIEFFIWKIL